MPEQLRSVGGSAVGDAVSLNEASQRLEAEGFTGQFAIADDATVRCFTCHQTSTASTVQLEALIRTEGASDPDDMVAVAAIHCPNPTCGRKGTLVVKYGPEMTPEEAEVLRTLEDLRDMRNGGISIVNLE